MPSTYSNIKIQLMATGENNTTWGNVTNINLGTALEEAIVGSADVTFASANVTLTLTDTNASQTARHMRLRCTGVTGGSTRNLIVPSIEKPYIVQNDCADSILVKTAAGTGITVPAGKTMWVYSDGTNVVNTTTHLSSLTLGTDLAVADGGTGASTFTANGVLLGNGTSAIQVTAVGATGQVLVGNTGGAPTWATLSGIGVTSLSFGSTGLTPATATTGAITVAGTLGVANGGTGTATAFTAGSVVFAGASGVYTQDNANFFWDDTNNRLGIGTATPGARLETSVNSAGATVEVLRLSNPGAGANTQAQINFSTTSTSYATITGGYGAAAPQMVFNLPSGTAGNYIWQVSGNEAMRIDTARNVGIGTSSPGSRLDVNGGDVYRAFRTSTTTGGSIEIGLLSQSIIGIQSLTNLSNFQSLVLNPNGGNVGIGTGSPGARLNVVGGDIAVDADARKIGYITDGTAANTGYMIPYDGSGFLSLHSNFATAGIKFHTGTGNAERMRITSAGNVGIGTSSPTNRLTVQATGDVAQFTNGSRSAFFALDSGGFTLLTGAGQTGNGMYASAGSNFTALYTASTERMRITSAGDVGIGTTTPSTKLDVNGTSNFSDNMTLSRTNTAGSLTGITVTNAGTSSAYAGINIISGPVTSQLFNDAAGNAVVAGAILRTTTAHPLVFGTNNTERMRILSGGDVGIGTGAPTVKLHVTVPAVTNTTTNAFRVTDGTYCDLLVSLATGTTLATSTLRLSTSAGSMAFDTSGIERMRIDASGNVGIGIAASDARLHLHSTAGGGDLPRMRFTNGGTGTGTTDGMFFGISNTSQFDIWNFENDAIRFATNNTERARITSGGNFLVGTTDLVTSSQAGVRVGPTGFIEISRGSGTNSWDVMSFINGNSTVGTINTNGTATTYNTSSDYRLKNVDGPITNSGAYVDALKPVQGSWKSDGSRFIGLLAHEVQEVSETPIATGEKDGEQMQAMDYSAPELIANLIAEIQSLRARVAQLEERK
jgi:hypothetical protein